MADDLLNELRQAWNELTAERARVAELEKLLRGEAEATNDLAAELATRPKLPADALQRLENAMNPYAGNAFLGAHPDEIKHARAALDEIKTWDVWVGADTGEGG